MEEQKPIALDTKNWPKDLSYLEWLGQLKADMEKRGLAPEIVQLRPGVSVLILEHPATPISQPSKTTSEEKPQDSPPPAKRD